MASEPNFHLFPDLPSEMRLKVWGFVLSEPRTLEIFCERGVYPGPKRYAKAFSANVPPPALLHVNRESRFEALNIYKAFFQTVHSTRCTYVAFDRDTIKVQEGVLGYVPKVELESIQSMTMEVKDPGYFGHFHMDILKRMPSLRELELVASNGIQNPPRWNLVEDAYIGGLRGEFDEAMSVDPGWDCPRVRIVSIVTGKEVAVIEGGASDPDFVNDSGPRGQEMLIMGELTWV